MLHIGCHLSFAKGFVHMGREALKINADTFQFFTRNPRGGGVRKMDVADVTALRELLAQHGFAKIVAHAPYTLNNCAAKPEIRAFARQAMADDLARLEYLPGNYYNFHPGSHVGQGIDEGIRLIADALNARGIPTVHETSLIDLGNYNDAYPRMAGLAEDWLARYPSIQMVLDVHRDSLETDDGTQLALRADVDGEACAKLLLVMGSNGSGLEHPGWRQNLANAAHLQALCEQRAPGLMRDLLLRASRYNQHLTPRSMLLEVGTAGNSLDEALRSADIFSQVLADCLLGKA